MINEIDTEDHRKIKSLCAKHNLILNQCTLDDPKKFRWIIERLLDRLQGSNLYAKDMTKVLAIKMKYI